MRIFNTKNQEGHSITFKGTRYFFIIHEEGIGIRRVDNKVPASYEVEALTQYLFKEGFANAEDFEC